MGLPLSTAAPRGLALDSGSLAALKGKAHAAPQEALKAAAGQFEALFLQNLMKSMRQAMPQDGPFDSDATRTYTEMLDAQLAQTLAKKGTGIADMLVRQLAHAVGGATESAPAPATPATTLTAPHGVRPAAVSTSSSSALALKALRAARDMAAPVRTPPPAAATSTPAPAAAAPAGGAVSKAAQTIGAFVATMRPYAEMAAQAMGVPVHYLLGQAALETGWGKSQPRTADGAPSHNLFGMKAGANWKGAVVEAMTTEYVDGKAVRTVERFRAYPSPREAFQDFAALLSRSGRYAGVRGTGSAETYATAMQRAGYATDPAYAGKLTRAIEAAARHAAPAAGVWTAQVPANAAVNRSTAA